MCKPLVNKNANIWSEAVMYLSRAAREIKSNYNDTLPIQVIVVYSIPGFQNPMEFSGARITIKSRKGVKRVQVEVAVPDMLFPEEQPEEAKKILLELMLEAVREVEADTKEELQGARNVIQEL